MIISKKYQNRPAGMQGGKNGRLLLKNRRVEEITVIGNGGNRYGLVYGGFVHCMLVNKESIIGIRSYWHRR